MPSVFVKDIEIANDKPMALIGGLNVLESRDLALKTAEHFSKITQKLSVPYISKPLSIKRIVLPSTHFEGRAWMQA